MLQSIRDGDRISVRLSGELDHFCAQSVRRELDALLQSSLPELPPDAVARAVTPCTRAMDRVLIGLALRTLTLNFLCLNHILPAVGFVLSLLGLRTLRRGNRLPRNRQLRPTRAFPVPLRRTAWFIIGTAMPISCPARTVPWRAECAA